MDRPQRPRPAGFEALTFGFGERTWRQTVNEINLWRAPSPRERDRKRPVCRSFEPSLRSPGLQETSERYGNSCSVSTQAHQRWADSVCIKALPDMATEKAGSDEVLKVALNPQTLAFGIRGTAYSLERRG